MVVVVTLALGRALFAHPGAYLEQGFAALDGLIALCKARGIYVILDLHAAPGAQNTELMSDSLDGVAHLWKEPAKYRQWTIDLWRTLAARYAGEPAVAGYDLLDEPFDDAESGSFAGDGASKILRPFYLDVTHAIREVDPEHILFVEGGDDWAKGFSGLEPAWDAQMVWTFHKYWDDNDEDSGKSDDIDGMARKIDSQPQLAAAIREAGLSSREFAVMTLALMQSGMAASVMKMRPKDDPDSLARAMKANPTNVRFYREHEAELTRRTNEMKAEMKAVDATSDE